MNQAAQSKSPMRSFAAVRFTTSRLDLRPLACADAPALFKMYSDAEFMRYWSSEPWTDVNQAATLIENDLRELAAGEHLRLGVFLRSGMDLVGTCSLFKLNEQSRRGEIGYGIARDWWRQGFMFESVSALIDFSFGEVGFNRLEADIDPRNTASALSLEKLGFRREGHLRQRWIVGGEVSDSAIYGLLAQDWRERGCSAA